MPVGSSICFSCGVFLHHSGDPGAAPPLQAISEKLAAARRLAMARRMDSPLNKTGRFRRTVEWAAQSSQSRAHEACVRRDARIR